MQESTPESKLLTPAYQRLVNLIETHADELSKSLVKDLKKRDSTSTYHTYDEKELYERAFTVYSHLGKWISKETTNEEIAGHYSALGTKRRKEGFPLFEVIQALTMTRWQLWRKVLSSGFLDTALDLNQALDLNNRVLLFFDRAIYYTAVGYERDE